MTVSAAYKSTAFLPSTQLGRAGERATTGLTRDGVTLWQAVGGGWVPPHHLWGEVCNFFRYMRVRFVGGRGWEYVGDIHTTGQKTFFSKHPSM